MAEYCRDFLTRPHPNQGRSGPVCPYTRRAVARRLLHLTSCRLRELDDEAIFQAMVELRSAYLEWDAELPEQDRLFHAVVVTFPHLPEPGISALIERLHGRLKPGFTDQGLMVGEFYPSCEAAGLHNPAFRPLQTPVAAFVIRHMTIGDAPFLLGDARFRAGYRRRFGEEGDRYMRTLLDRAPDLARAPLKRAGSAAPTLQSS